MLNVEIANYRSKYTSRLPKIQGMAENIQK
jgi:hypothetical protein